MVWPSTMYRRKEAEKHAGHMLGASRCYTELLGSDAICHLLQLQTDECCVQPNGASFPAHLPPVPADAMICLSLQNGCSSLQDFCGDSTCPVSGWGPEAACCTACAGSAVAACCRGGKGAAMLNSPRLQILRGDSIVHQTDAGGTVPAYWMPV